ncbi:phosphinothricin acetyltransferase [Clostridium cavendishii DSM 21758]|uniref:Phosphinothricin acetyltransferase n=1 Tax=Clostridium cavendishii DSM 21758 TaxID=1121302 RepID=A0A1M6D6N6_9CLOT|nr:GNAT family N-acetyltransferase [Clostridium cavendishii]SHI68885.1 phosphinothricin acetyltransferase [Clostridium cavendishii DSM 21758]
MDFKITEMLKEDWKQVEAVYLEGIKTRIATFQTETPTWVEWNKNHMSSCRLVVKYGNHILGWCALSPMSSRCVYRGVAEISIYISEKYRGHGIGTLLLNELIAESEKCGIWTLQSNVIKENVQSRKLHEKCGFREVGIREKVAKMDNTKWMDVVILERRSKIIGVD